MPAVAKREEDVFRAYAWPLGVLEWITRPPVRPLSRPPGPTGACFIDLPGGLVRVNSDPPPACPGKRSMPRVCPVHPNRTVREVLEDQQLAHRGAWPRSHDSGRVLSKC